MLGVFVLAWNLLSTFGYQHLIGYHYVMRARARDRHGHGVGGLSPEDEAAPPDRGRVRFRMRAVDGIPVGDVRVVALRRRPGTGRPRTPAVKDLEAIRKQVPPNAVITAYHSIVPHLDHRKRIYMWPVPFHAVYWGQLNKEGQTLPFTNDIEYLVLPTTLLAEDQKIFETIKDQFEVVSTNATATLYKRKGTP